MVQSLNESQFQIFNDLGELVLRKIMKILNDSALGVSDVAVVFDRYDKEDSIKAMERNRRGGGEILSSHIISGTRTVPNYKQFLKSSGNKASIAAFISIYVEEKAKSRLPSRKSIILSGGYKDGQMAKHITQNDIVELNHLFSTQEEAGTRVILPAVDFRDAASRIIIRADDTDILVLLLFYSAKGSLAPEVYMHTGHASKIITRERFIPVHTIAEKLGERFCLCLPALHSLTGCDTTSAIYKIGKRTAYKTLQKNEEKSEALSTVGEMSIEEAVEIARTLLLLMYGKKEEDVKHWMS